MLPLEQLRARVLAQKTAIPAIYGGIAFERTPERFAGSMDDVAMMPPAEAARRPEILADTALIERMRLYTMLGDTVADAYAALMPAFGFRRLIDMLTLACDQGIAAVTDAPAELCDFIAAMEATPAWVNLDLVEEGARIDRNAAANLSPFFIRGAFIATFMNKYSALPMALTGTLSHSTAARRIKETATFFATTVLPGALRRHGPGFKAAALVRLMHSMVRFNAVAKPGLWDSAVYGIPIPQIDQMPAGLIPIFLLADTMRREGRKDFTAAERARVELARYRCFLLGLPEELLADTAEGVHRIMSAYRATLRQGFDDKTCGVLLRATLAAYLPPDRRITSRAFDHFERRFAKVFFVRTFLAGNRQTAAAMGVQVSALDEACFMVGSLFVVSRLAAYRAGADLPLIGKLLDRVLVSKLHAQLRSYGHAEYITDATAYRPALAV